MAKKKKFRPNSNIPASNSGKQILTQQSIAYSRGPLPPPEQLQKYGEIVEDGAERIFKQFEKQTAHRHEIEKLNFSASIKHEKLGLVFGFIICLLCLSNMCGSSFK